MVRKLKRNEINSFIDFGDSVYKDDPNYVPFMRGDLKKTIEKLVFEKGSYTALCSFDESGNINGRMLLSIGSSKQLNTEKCAHFSHFEIVDDQAVFDELFGEASRLMKEKVAELSMFLNPPALLQLQRLFREFETRYRTSRILN